MSDPAINKFVSKSAGGGGGGGGGGLSLTAHFSKTDFLTNYSEANYFQIIGGEGKPSNIIMFLK